MTRRRLNVREAAEELGITVDAARMRARRGSLDSEHDEGRLYIWLDTDSSETKHDVQGESSALISAKEETIRILEEQLEAERRAAAELRRILAGLVQRVPELEATSEPAVADRREQSEERGWSGNSQPAPEEQPGSEIPTPQRPWWRFWG